MISHCDFDLHFPDMLSIFHVPFGPLLCVLWKNVYSDPLPIFNLGCLFSDVDLHMFFVYFVYLLLNGYIVCQYLLSFSRQFFCFIDSFLCCAEDF